MNWTLKLYYTSTLMCYNVLLKLLNFRHKIALSQMSKCQVVMYRELIRYNQNNNSNI